MLPSNLHGRAKIIHRIVSERQLRKVERFGDERRSTGKTTTRSVRKWQFDENVNYEALKNLRGGRIRGIPEN